MSCKLILKGDDVLYISLQGSYTSLHSVLNSHSHSFHEVKQKVDSCPKYIKNMHFRLEKSMLIDSLKYKINFR